YLQTDAPVAEIRERHDAVAADAQHVFEHRARPARRLQSLRQDDVIEGVVRIILQVGVGVALDDGEAFGDAFVDALARQFYAAAVDAAAFQKPQQFAVAAANVEHPRAALHHVGDQNQSETRAPRAAGASRQGKTEFESRQHAN